MSIFSNILVKLGLKKEDQPAPAAEAPKPGGREMGGHTPAPAAPIPAPAAPAPAVTHTMPAAPATPKPVETKPQPTPMAPPVGYGPKSTPESPKPVEAAPAPTPMTPPVGYGPTPTAATPKPVEAPHVEAIPVVDVVAHLEALAAKRPEKLNWKTSIADLLFLLGIDHSYQARKELAVELGCPANLMDDSAKMNTWLHKTVLAKIAENGGNIPKELLD